MHLGLVSKLAEGGEEVENGGCVRAEGCLGPTVVHLGFGLDQSFFFSLAWIWIIPPRQIFGVPM